MINNDVLRSVRYMLDLSDARIVEIVQLADPAATLDKGEVAGMLLREDQPGAIEVKDPLLARFLDGLVYDRRGKDETAAPRALEKRMTNNLVLKKLRVAFELKDADMHEILNATGFPVSKPELNALFRQPGHRNYRDCGDQLLRNFLKGLTTRIRG